MRSEEEIEKRYVRLCNMMEYAYDTGAYIRPDEICEYKLLKWVLEDETD